MSRNKWGRAEPTHEWEQIELLCAWPEQRRYEQIRPLVLFDVPVSGRSEEIGLSPSTLYRRLNAFESEGMESLFGSDSARRKKLPSAMRRLIVDLKAEYPPFNLNEIANIVHACFGRKPDVRSVALDALGYVTLMRWRLYAEEGLAGKEADLWLLERTLTVEHAEETLGAYEVDHDPAGGRGGSGRLLAVRRPTLFETPFASGQMRLFDLTETLGEDGWLKVLRLDEYASRSAHRPRRCSSRFSSPTRTPFSGRSGRILLHHRDSHTSQG
jgi:hypothetical protein